MQIGNKRLEDAHSQIQMNMQQIKESIHGTPLFGAVGSSTALNLANKHSDVDVYLVINNDAHSLSGVNIYNFSFSGIEYEFICVPIDELIQECEKYNAIEHRYPTRFYRTQDETDKIKLTEDSERPDYKREMVMRIYMADSILEFEKGSAKKNYEKLKKGCLLIDIWDSYFNRAYGNYYEKIKGHEQVLLRKYLYAISEMTICRLLLKEYKKPIMDFKRMFTVPYCPYADTEIIGLCNKLWEDNQTINTCKENTYIPANLYLNQWMEKQLSELVSEMNKKEDFLRSSYLSFDE